MGLSEEDRQRIIEEERLREEIRSKSPANRLVKGCGLFVVMLVLASFALMVGFAYIIIQIISPGAI